MAIGQVIGSTTLRSFRFVIKEGSEEYVKRDEFVTVDEAVTGSKILGVIKDIVITNELLPDDFGRDLRLSDIILKEGEYPVPQVKVLGAINEERVETPRHGIKPGSDIELASDNLLDKMLKVPDERAALIGNLSTRPSVGVGVDINEMVSRHIAVLAMTGAGKSYTVGVIVEELMAKGGALVVFDLHNEFRGIEIDGVSTRIYDTSGGGRIRVDVSSLTTTDFKNLMPDMTSAQRDLLDEVLGIADRFFTSYDLNNINNILEAVYDYKREEDNQKASMYPSKVIKSITKKVGASTVGALMRRLKRLERMGVFSCEGTPLNEVVRPGQLSIINLADTDDRVADIIVAAILRGVFQGRKANLKDGKKGVRTPAFIIIEEAHNFAPRSADGEYRPTRGILRKIAREGRKFGVGLCIVSQRPGKLDSDILSQCNTQIIMKIVNPSDQEHIRQSVEAVTEDIVADLPGLGRGEAIIAGSAVRMPVPVRIRKRRTRISGQDIDIVGHWARGV